MATPSKLSLWVFLSLLVATLRTVPCGAQAAKVEDLRVSFASFGVIYYPYFIVKELGFYRDEGFNVDWIAMPGGLATKALVSGDIHFSTSSGSSLDASLRDIKLKVVYVNLDRPMYRLLSWRDDIRKVTDLREYSRAGDCPVSALYATFNIQTDSDRAREEGWQWMERFFEQAREKLGYHFTIFGTADECVRLLRGYAGAGLTTIIARIASDDVRAQARLLLHEIRPQWVR